MRLLVSLMTTLALVLTACGGTDTTDTTDTTEPTEPTETATTAPDDTGADEDAEEEEPADATEEPTEEPADDDATDEDVAAGDCSAAGLDSTVQGDGLPEEAAATAAFLLDAVVRCDEQLLYTAAQESQTSFSFGSATVDEVFVLPEDPDADPSAWEALARLLGSTTPVGDGEIWTWPAAAGPDAGDDAWQELVDSDLYTQAQVDELRSAGEGYLGWRVGIEADGTWLFFTAGD